MTVCFRVMVDFMVPLSTDGNCRVKDLQSTSTYFKNIILILKKIKKNIKGRDNSSF